MNYKIIYKYINNIHILILYYNINFINAICITMLTYYNTIFITMLTYYNTICINYINL